MTLPRDIDSYGGVFEDELPVQNPTTEQGAAYGNRLHEDVGHMTNTSTRWAWTFPTTTTAAVTTVSAAGVVVHSHAGAGSAAKPVISKTATGVYECTCPASFVDALGTTEVVTFFWAQAAAMDATQCAVCSCVVASNVVTVYVRDSATQALTDLGGGITIAVGAR